MTGTTGTTGVTGVQGAQGIQGAQGSSGTTGIGGETGVPGVTGVTGVTGLTGVTGTTGVTGVAGVGGETGDTGITGITGIAGIQGATGIQGELGETGETGVTGVRGTPGTTGIAGILGSGGILGEDGQYIIGQTLDILGISTLTLPTLSSGTNCFIGNYASNGLSYYNAIQVNPAPSPIILQPNGGFVGIGTYGPAAQLHVVGSAAKSITVTWNIPSDARIKKNIENAPLKECRDIIANIPVRSFEWDTDRISTVMHDTRVLGFIAQEVQEVLPSSITTIDAYGFSNFLTLNTDQIFKANIGATQYVMQKSMALDSTLQGIYKEQSRFASKLI